MALVRHDDAGSFELFLFPPLTARVQVTTI